MLEKLWTEISGYCFSDEGGRGEKFHLRFTKGSKKLNFSGFVEKVGLYSEGLGGQNSTLVRSFEFSGGGKSVWGDAAVLYGASKNYFEATGGQFLTFWPTAFSIYFFRPTENV